MLCFSSFELNSRWVPLTVTTTGYPCKIQRQVVPVVQKVDNAIHCLHNLIGFPNTYPPDSDLSGG